MLHSLSAIVLNSIVGLAHCHMWNHDDLHVLGLSIASDSTTIHLYDMYNIFYAILFLTATIGYNDIIFLLSVFFHTYMLFCGIQMLFQMKWRSDHFRLRTLNVAYFVLHKIKEFQMNTLNVPVKCYGYVKISNKSYCIVAAQMKIFNQVNYRWWFRNGHHFQRYVYLQIVPNDVGYA